MARWGTSRAKASVRWAHPRTRAAPATGWRDRALAATAALDEHERGDGAPGALWPGGKVEPDGQRRACQQAHFPALLSDMRGASPSLWSRVTVRYHCGIETRRFSFPSSLRAELVPAGPSGR